MDLTQGTTLKYNLLFFEPPIKIGSGAVEKASNLKVRRDMGDFIEVSGDRCVTGILGGVTQMFDKSVTKTTFGLTNVDFVAFGACDCID